MSARYQLLLDATIPEWQDPDPPTLLKVGLPIPFLRWIEAAGSQAGLAREDIIFDAARWGSLCVRAVQCGLRVGHTPDNLHFRDRSGVFGGPMPPTTEDAFESMIPGGTGRLIKTMNRPPERVVYDGIWMLGLAMGGGDKLVIAALGNRPGPELPRLIHDGQALPVVPANDYSQVPPL
jgi:hypothetical protein